MDRNLSYIKERILYLTDIKKLIKEDFFKSIGMTYGNFKGKNKDGTINSDAIEKILTIIPDLNLHWLITGKGAPLMNSINQEVHGDHTVSSQVNDVNGNVTITQNEIQKMMELQLRCIELQKEFTESLKACQQDKDHAREQIMKLMEMLQQKL